MSRTTPDVLAMRFDEADMTDLAGLKDFAALTAQRIADRDRLRSVVGVRRPARDWTAPAAGVERTLRIHHATALRQE